MWRAVLLVYLCLTSLSAGQTKLPTAQEVIPVGGSGGWDLLFADTLAHRLYVSHSDRVIVIDLDRNRVIGQIPNTPRVHGIAVAPDFDRGFTSNGGDTSVTVFNLATDSAEAKIRVTGVNPDVILYDPFSRRVFVFNGRSSTADVIDPQSLKIVGTIPLDGKPEMAVTDLKGRVYVNIEDKSTISVIDAQSLKVIASWPIAPCEEPTGLAIDRAHSRLFAAGGNKLLAVIDAESGKVITTVPIGARVDGAAFDAATQCVFSPNGEGSLTVIRQESAGTYTVAGTIPTVKGARTIALDERTNRLYLPVGTRPDSTGASKDDFRVLVYQL